MLRWPSVQRIWLPAWLDDSASVLDRLEELVRAPRVEAMTLESAVELAPTPPSHISSQSLPDLDDNRFDETHESGAHMGGSPAPFVRDVGSVGLCSLPGEEAFVPWQVESKGTLEVLDHLQNARHARRVQNALVDVVNAEGPVHVERLAKLVASAFGLSRVSASRAAAIIDQLPRELRSGDFAWPAGRHCDSWSGFRRDADATRSLEHISLRELANAMVALCASTGGMERDELLRETLAVFGGRDA